MFVNADMNRISSDDVTREIVERAKCFGADLAGIADIELLKRSPSHQILNSIGMQIGAVGAKEMTSDFQIQWPHEAGSVLVIAIAHPQDSPEMDWWRGKGTFGNDTLIRIKHEISVWIEGELGIKTRPLPYNLESGGIFIKDAGALAGMGCIGKNNMLVSRDYGPRVRLRAMLVDAALQPTGPVDFDPCRACHEPCLVVCPQKAFASKVYSSAKLGFNELPGRSGRFDRYLCNLQMKKDIDDAGSMVSGDRQRVVKYCRRCEFACPIGRLA
jgi:epoxyqueuosine reductase